MKTAVVNNKAAMVIGQLPSMGKELGGRTMLGGIVVMMPGLNLVSSKDLATLRQNKIFELNFTTAIEMGVSEESRDNARNAGRNILEVLMFKKKDKDGKTVEVTAEVEDEFPLAKLTEQQCKEMVDLVDVPEMLRQWGTGETRPFVAHAISTRLKKITGEEE